MATTAVDTAMVATDMAVATTARGRLRLSPATATAVDTAAMVVTAAMAMVATAGATATARGLLSPAMDPAATAMVATDTAGATATTGDTATGVSYHQIRRSELSQKQNYKNSQR